MTFLECVIIQKPSFEFLHDITRQHKDNKQLVTQAEYVELTCDALLFHIRSLPSRRFQQHPLLAVIHSLLQWPLSGRCHFQRIRFPCHPHRPAVLLVYLFVWVALLSPCLPSTCPSSYSAFLTQTFCHSWSPCLSVWDFCPRFCETKGVQYCFFTHPFLTFIHNFSFYFLKPTQWLSK